MHEEPVNTAFEEHDIDRAGDRYLGPRLATIGKQAAEFSDIPSQSLKKIAIKVKGSILFINPADVIAVQAEGNYVLLLRAAGSYLLRESISVVAEKFKAYGFIRIHRSVLVNTAFVEEIRPNLTGEYGLRVKGGREYTVSRTYKQNLRSIADVWIGGDTLFTE